MNDTVQQAIDDGKVFRVGDSYPFALNVPDDSVGISGSRCSHCENKTAYCRQLCQHCGLPFVGPYTLPQWDAWNVLDLDMRKYWAINIFVADGHGRGLCMNVHQIPLTPSEAKPLRDLSPDEERMFKQAHDKHSYELLYI